MYFILPENLPESVIRVSFDFRSDENPSFHFVSPDLTPSDNGITIAVPDEASHIRSLHFQTHTDRFLYYFPNQGYRIANGIHLPPLIPPAIGDLYAGGLVIQTGIGHPNPQVEADILPYKGTVMALHEQTCTYYEAILYCENLSEHAFATWRLPDMLELALFHNKQEELNLFLLKQNASLLYYGNEYWCHDNSVADLGVAFNMNTGVLEIFPKKAKKQVRAVRFY